MAYPPETPPSTRNEDTLQAGNHPQDHNLLAAAIADIVAELGANPSGAYASLDDRLVAVAAAGEGAVQEETLDADVATLIGDDVTPSATRTALTAAINEEATSGVVASGSYNIPLGTVIPSKDAATPARIVIPMGVAATQAEIMYTYGQYRVWLSVGTSSAHLTGRYGDGQGTYNNEYGVTLRDDDPYTPAGNNYFAQVLGMYAVSGSDKYTWFKGARIEGTDLVLYLTAGEAATHTVSSARPLKWKATV